MKKKATNPTHQDLSTRLIQEIKTPLKSLTLNSQKLLDKYKVKNFEYISYKDYKQLLFSLELMNKQLHRCYQSAVNLSGHQHPSIQVSCDINQIASDLLKTFKNQFINSKIKTYIRLSKNIPFVKLSRMDAHQVIHQVISNSINAMPAGGRIKVSSSYDKKEKCVLVEIDDEGVGISPERLSRIFEPFHSTKEQGVEKSSGLGLSIVYSILQSIGGTIKIESSLRSGTIVKLFIPAV